MLRVVCPGEVLIGLFPGKEPSAMGAMAALPIRKEVEGPTWTARRPPVKSEES